MLVNFWDFHICAFIVKTKVISETPGIFIRIHFACFVH